MALRADPGRRVNFGCRPGTCYFLSGSVVFISCRIGAALFVNLDFVGANEGK